MMRYWKLSPIAREDDRHWRDYGYKRPLLVKAGAAAEARVKATGWYVRQFQEYHDLNTSQCHRSAFEDENLYEAIRLNGEMFEYEKDRYPMI